MEWQQEKMPATVELAQLNTNHKQYRQKQKYNEWIETQNRHNIRIREQQHRFKCDDLFIKAQFEYADPHKLNHNVSKYLAKDTMQCDGLKGNI